MLEAEHNPTTCPVCIVIGKYDKDKDVGLWFDAHDTVNIVVHIRNGVVYNGERPPEPTKTR